MKKLVPYIVGIIFVLAIGALSGLMTQNASEMYQMFAVKPPLSPPGFIFPIVWTILYTLMGISATRIYKSQENTDQRKSALGIFILQLMFNFFWPLWFFNMQAYLFSFIWLVILIILVIIMIVRFYKIDKWAGLIQIPYLLWLIFAAYLNFAVYLLNK